MKCKCDTKKIKPKKNQDEIDVNDISYEDKSIIDLIAFSEKEPEGRTVKTFSI